MHQPVTESFHPGERAIVDIPTYQRYHLTRVTIISYLLRDQEAYYPPSGKHWRGDFYKVRLFDGTTVFIPPDMLRREWPGSGWDMYQIGSWADCPWRPRNVDR